MSFKDIKKEYDDAANNNTAKFLDLIIKGEEKPVADFIEKNPQAVNTPEPRTGWTPLIIAAGEGHETIVNLLLEKGAELDAKDKKGLTAMLTAGRNGRLRMAAQLIRKGADTSIQDNTGKNIFAYAQQHGYLNEFTKLALLNSITGKIGHSDKSSTVSTPPSDEEPKSKPRFFKWPDFGRKK